MTLEQRVDRLERQCRWWRGACIIAVLAMLAIGGTEKVAPSDGEFANLTASHLILRNPAGGPSLNVTAGIDETSLQIMNPASGTSVALDVGKDGANLFLTRNTAKGMASVAIGADSVSGSIGLHDVTGKSRQLEP